MKILNLYAGIGGNRKLWGDDHDITAVEWDEPTAEVYQDYFPNDTVIVGDAHQYLLDHFYEYDFVWSSPPCPTHSKFNNMRKPNGYRDINYPDMSLYQEIIVLQKWGDDVKWVVENVDPFYDPLIPAIKVGRHLFWSNMKIYPSHIGHIGGNPIKNWTPEDYEKEYGYDLSKYKFEYFDKRKRLRNCVNPPVGKYILDRAQDIITKSNTEQKGLFND